MLVQKQNYLTEKVIDPFICLGSYVDTRFILITLGIISSAFKNNPAAAHSSHYLIQFVEKVLKLESHEVNTSVIEIYETQLKEKLEEYTKTLASE